MTEGESKAFVSGFVAALAQTADMYDHHESLASIGLYSIRAAVKAGAQPEDARSLKSAFEHARYWRSLARRKKK